MKFKALLLSFLLFANNLLAGTYIDGQETGGTDTNLYAMVSNLNVQVSILSNKVIGVAYVTSNNTYNAGTTQFMASAEVSTPATNGNQVVNYNTLTNALAGTTGSDVIYSISTNLAFLADQSTTNFALTNMQFNVCNIVRGRLYVADTNIVPFSQTATLTFRNQQARASGAALWQASMGLTAVLISSNAAVGTTNIFVQDATEFFENNLLYLTGLTNEFARVLTTSGNNVILKYPTIASHVISNGCSRVREIGGFTVYDSSSNKTIWGSVDLTTMTNVNLILDIQYSK